MEQVSIKDWVDTALGLIEEAEYNELRDEVDQICGMIGGLIRRAEGRKKPDKGDALDREAEKQRSGPKQSM